MITAAAHTSKDRDGNGKHTPLARIKKEEAKEKVQEFVYLDKADKRMRFNNSKDPIYFAFEYLEKRTVAQLASDFVKDSIYEITTFVSRVVK
jgi:hypothetical protein